MTSKNMSFNNALINIVNKYSPNNNCNNYKFYNNQFNKMISIKVLGLTSIKSEIKLKLKLIRIKIKNRNLR